MSSPRLATLVVLVAPLLALAQPAPRVVVVRSVPGERTSSIAIETAGATEPAAPLATFDHQPWAAIRGVVLPDGSPLVVTDLVRRGDGSFGAALLGFANREPRVLVDRVFHAARPLVTAQGRVFVERGQEGLEPTEEEVKRGQLRTDAMTVDEVNPSTGEVRTVHRWSGYTAHLAGSFGQELFLYRVRPGYADLVAVNMDSGAVRPLTGAIEPMARDFSVDAPGNRMVFTNFDRATDAWRVIELNLKTRGQRPLAARVPPGAAPSVWPRGRVVWNKGDRTPREVQAVSPSARWVALREMAPSEPPIPMVVAADESVQLRIPAARGVRVDILGFIPEAQQ